MSLPQGSNATRATTAGGATYVGLTLLLAILNAAANPDLRTGLPGWVEVFLAPLVPALVTLVAGYLGPEPTEVAPNRHRG
jgi:hypothetical protein